MAEIKKLNEKELEIKLTQKNIVTKEDLQASKTKLEAKLKELNLMLDLFD